MAKILTFNWHESYLSLLAKTGHEFFVFEPLLVPGQHRKWDFRFRPLAPNMKIISEKEMKDGLDAKFFDLAVCQNVKDFVLTIGWAETPKILVFHNRLSTEIALGDDTVSRKTYLGQLTPLLEQEKVGLVFVSKSKMDDWGLPGDVIPPGVPTEEYGGWKGDIEKILRVGNRIMERDMMMGYTIQQEVCAGLPNTLLGDNPQIPGCRQSESWEDLKNHFRSHRAYLNTTLPPHEDGYNLGMLEAMASGMPVVSVANPTSPLTDGKDGFLSGDVQQLRRSASLLLKDPLLAKSMGENARKTVAEKFPLSAFVSKWNNAISNAVTRRKTGQATRLGGPEKRLNILMDFAYYPATTAHYLRRAFSQKFNVVTSGPSLPKELITAWKLEKMKAPILDQDVPRAAAPDIGAIFAKLPAGFEPDIFLWCETGISLPPPGMDGLRIPKVAYMVDTHISLNLHIQIARLFDAVFLAHRDYVVKLKEAGIKNVFWLPLGCDPQIHGKRNKPKIYDVGFVGTITDEYPRRGKLLNRLKERFNVHIERLFGDDMAEMYSESKIVFNNAIKYDLNMRVFEALCSGTMLLTDDAEALKELFEDGRHLVVYSDDNIVEKAEYYLRNDAERERIASAGRELALQKHTYLHRGEEMVARLESLFGPLGEKKGVVSAVANPPTGDYFHNVRADVAALVPPNAVKILEIGCSSGSTGRLLKKENPGRELVGVEYDKKSSDEAGKIFDRVFCGDAERIRLPYPEKYFDCIIYADVLEHLNDPWSLLKRHRKLLAPNGTIVMSIPNARHAGLVTSLAEGRWTYDERGLLDKTHLRFFTLSEIKAMLDGAGYDAYSITWTREDDVWKDGLRGTLDMGRLKMHDLTEPEMLEFFIYQYLVIATPKQINEAEEDPSHPAFYRKLLLAEFPELKTDEEIIKLGPTLAGLKPVMAGYCDMAVGNFKGAGKTFRKAGEINLEACALAGAGLTLDALKILSRAKNDKGADALTALFRYGQDSPEAKAVSAFEPEKSDVGATALCRLEREADPVGAITAAQNSLKPGGVMAVFVNTGADENAYPAPLHVFTPDGIKKLLTAVGGFENAEVMELLPGLSALAVCQKSPGTGLDFAKLINKRLAETADEKARQYWGEGLYEAVEQAARAALSLDSENAGAISILGDCHLQKNDLDGAEVFYKKAVAVTGDRGAAIAGPYMGLGTLSLIREDFESAGLYFEKAREITPENHEALSGLGTALVRLGKAGDGLEYCKKALALNPDSEVAINSLVQARWHLGEFAAAESDILKFLELHPANTNVLCNLAVVQSNLKKNGEAADTLEKILMFQPDHEAALALKRAMGLG